MVSFSFLISNNRGRNLAVHRATVPTNTKKTRELDLECLQIEFYYFYMRGFKDENRQKTLSLRYATYNILYKATQ